MEEKSEADRGRGVLARHNPAIICKWYMQEAEMEGSKLYCITWELELHIMYLFISKCAVIALSVLTSIDAVLNNMAFARH